MNTIPVVSPDSGIAPRTGSGSPQTPSQQRADNAPTVLSDTGVSADPGVLLKIAPPVLSRESTLNIDQRLPADQLAAFLAKQQIEKQGVVLVLENSAEHADQAIVSRVADMLAALPPDVQEAIKNASTPAIAQLLKLVALTSSGIKEAPAVFQAVRVPLAPQPEVAATALLQDIAQSDSMRLAAALRAVLQNLSFGVRPLTDQETFRLNMPNLALDSAESNIGAQGKALSNPVGRQVSPNNAQAMSSIDDVYALAGQPTIDATGLINVEQSRHQNVATAYQNPNQALLNFFDQAINPQSDESTETPNQASSGFNNEHKSHLANLTHGINAITVQQADQGLREGLKLLMDGRLIWQGEFTQGVQLRLERTDAWQADRKGVGGMEKGTSLRVQLRLPSVGLLEIRALGFQGQVSIRVHAEAKATPSFAGALPDLISRLKQRGLSGAQVVVDSL